MAAPTWDPSMGGAPPALPEAEAQLPWPYAGMGGAPPSYAPEAAEQAAMATPAQEAAQPWSPAPTRTAAPGPPMAPAVPPTIPLPQAPARPALPEGLRGQHAGYYYPPDYPDVLSRALVEDRITPAQAEEGLRQYQAWQRSTPGLAVQAGRLGTATDIDRGRLRQQQYEQSATRFAQLASMHAQAAADEERATRDAQRQIAARQQAYDQHMVRYEQALADVSRQEVDPSHFWRSQSTGGGIMAALGLALGTLGSMIGGPAVPNNAMEIIQRRIDQDIDLQKDALARRERGVGAQVGILGMMREQIGDERMAEAAARAAINARYARMAEEFGALDGRDEAIAAAKDVAAQLRSASALSELQYRGMAQQYADAQVQAAAAAQGAASQKQRQAAMLDWAPWDKEARERAVPSLGLLAPTAKDAEVIKTKLAQVRTINDGLQELEALVDRGAAMPRSPEAARYQALASNLITEVNVVQGQGAISSGDAERVQASIPMDVSAFASNDQIKARLQTARRHMEESVRNEQVARGAVPYERAPMLDAKGVPRVMYREGTPQSASTGAAPLTHYPVR